MKFKQPKWVIRQLKEVRKEVSKWPKWMQPKKD